MNKRFLHFCLASCLMFLVACADDSDKTEDTDKHEPPAPKTAEVLPICPQVAIVKELEAVNDYAGETPTKDQLVAAALMRNVVGTCSYADAGIDVTFDLNFAAERGPKLGGLKASFPFFVAVVAPNATVLNKELMTLELKFSSDTPFADRSESLHVLIPIDKSKRSTGPDYQVLMGFQLTKDQLEQTKKETMQ